jgi:DNA repair protein RecO (recombination protein O)
VLDDRLALAAIGSLSGLVRLLPERDPHPELYAATLDVLRSFDDFALWPARLVRWELQLLQELGFGLDLSECAATGAQTELAYVSPRSGRAVSREAGQPYGGKLLGLPAFMLDDDATADRDEIAAGFALTGYFLERDVLAPHGLAVPQARERLIAFLAHSSKIPA